MVKANVNQAIKDAAEMAGQIGATLDLGTDTLLVKAAKSKVSYLLVAAVFGAGMAVGVVFSVAIKAIF